SRIHGTEVASNPGLSRQPSSTRQSFSSCMVAGPCSSGEPMTVARVFFTPLARSRFAAHYVYARATRKMSWLEAIIYTCLAVLTHMFLRLEAPAWQLLRERWGPWFEHLKSRPYRHTDPLRYLLQALWLLL